MKELEQFLQGLKKRNPHETEFDQAVVEVVGGVVVGDVSSWLVIRDPDETNS